MSHLHLHAVQVLQAALWRSNPLYIEEIASPSFDYAAKERWLRSGRLATT